MLQRAHSLETYGVDPHPCKVTSVEDVHFKNSLAVRPGAVDIDQVPLIKVMQISFLILVQFIHYYIYTTCKFYVCYC